MPKIWLLLCLLITTVDCLDFVIDLCQPVLWSMISCAGWTWTSVTLSWRRRFLCSPCEGGTRRTVAYSSYPSRETETPTLLLVSPSNTLFNIVQIIMSPILVLAFLDYLAVSPCCHSRFSLSNRFYKYLFGVAFELNKQVVDKRLTWAGVTFTSYQRISTTMIVRSALR